ncbi:MAG: contact-dependent growth inhibition system immunity protein [Chthoniobacter sp.]|uniref:contact-dependent growth inhibition system immunity protein n=1 Tax=Chthoniobacter sp. TaxID=2510640 RepID=UPI0032A4ED65
MQKFDRDKSLQQLEGQDWGEPTYDSHLVIECHRLRRVPLHEFTAEDLRIMILQQIGLPFLIPLALELLRVDPFTSGDLYEGVLLETVLRAEADFWREHPQLRGDVAEIAERAFSLLPALDGIDRQTAQEVLTDAFELFQRR